MTVITHQTLNEKAYNEIRNSLMSGLLAPGQVLTIRGLAAMYGISATPIREALKQLVAEQALEVLPNRSIIVPTLTREKFLELRNIRLALEGMCAEIAAPSLGGSRLRKLEGLVQRMEAALASGDGSSYLRQNEAFHFTIYKAARSPILLGYIERLWMQVGPYFHFLFQGSSFSEDANEAHIAVLKAIRSRDPAAVKLAVRNDIMVAAEHLLPRIGAREEGASEGASVAC